MALNGDFNVDLMGFNGDLLKFSWDLWGFGGFWSHGPPKSMDPILDQGFDWRFLSFEGNEVQKRGDRRPHDYMGPLYFHTPNWPAKIAVSFRSLSQSSHLFWDGNSKTATNPIKSH